MNKSALALAATAALASGVVFSGSAAADAEGAFAVWKIVCVQTEDDWGPDETFLTYSGAGGARLWGPSAMNNGDSHDIVGVSVNPGDSLTIWDEDAGTGSDPHDNLGERVVPSGPGPHMITFEGQGAKYELYVG